MKNMKWNCWNGPSPLGHSLSGPAHGAFRPEAEAGKSLPPLGAGGSPVKSGRLTARAREEAAGKHAREEGGPNLGFWMEGGSLVWARGGSELGGGVRYPRVRWCSGR
jgi:hypothetical protein